MTPSQSFAYSIAADGHAVPLQLSADRRAVTRTRGRLLWRHIDGNDSECRRWLREEARLHETVLDALEALETRPRTMKHGDGALVVLRGVNQNPDADPGDLVSIRLWVTAREVLSVSFRPMLAIGDMVEVVRSGAVRDAGDFIVELAEVLVRRLDDTLEGLSRSLDTIEEDILDGKGHDIRYRIGAVRRTAIGLRRYIAPQREALALLSSGPFGFFDSDDRQYLAEAANSVTRILEEIDSIRDQAAVLSDQLSDIRAEAVGKRTLVLSIVSAVFLPLTYIAGLIGMNVAGIPFAREPWSFGAIVFVNLLMALAIIAWLRWRGWFD